MVLTMNTTTTCTMNTTIELLIYKLIIYICIIISVFMFGFYYNRNFDISLIFWCISNISISFMIVTLGGYDE